MNRVGVLLLVIGGVIGSGLPAPGAALANWPAGPYTNVPVSIGPGNQSPAGAIADGAGGMIIVWHDDRTGSGDVYAQRIAGDGTTLWTAGGVPLCTYPNWQYDPVMVSDGAGGVVVVWSDYRNGGIDLYAQAVSATGVVKWAVDGVAVNLNPVDPYGDQVAGDGAGGAIVTWYEFRDGHAVLLAQRISAAGAVLWAAGGVPVAPATLDSRNPAIVSDGQGGAILGWQDSPDGFETNVYAQRLAGDGTLLWGASGTAVCTTPGQVFPPSALADGAGGAIFAWADNRLGPYSDIYAQRVDANGVCIWEANGNALCTANLQQYDTSIISDNAGGAIVAWHDARTSPYDYYAQHVSDLGELAWPTNGVAICGSSGSVSGFVMASDGAGGVQCAWSDQRENGHHLYGQRLTASGSRLWAGGLGICLATGAQFNPRVVSGSGGWILTTWGDNRNDFNASDIYAQGIDSSGAILSAATITGVKDIAGDQGGKVRVTWNRSHRDTAPGYEVGLYGIWRQVTAAAAQGALAGGAALAGVDDQTALPQPGVFRATADGDKVRYWEGVGTVAARGQSTYTFVASTLQDSTSAGPAWSVFMVDTHLAFQPGFVDSSPDSGYSVDNLAPPMPTPFTGRYQAGATALHWGSSFAVDMAGYRLHRGSVPGFVPGPANLVATTVDVDYVDHVAGNHYYQLFAMDIHGNLSPAAQLAPQQTSPVPDGPIAALRLAPNVPNPFNPSTTLRFELPDAGRARVVVFDLAGKLVRTLADGPYAAGRHEVVWDGRDAAGRDLGSGNYLARVEFAGRSESVRMTLVR